MKGSVMRSIRHMATSCVGKYTGAESQVEWAGKENVVGVDENVANSLMSKGQKAINHSNEYVDYMHYAHLRFNFFVVLCFTIEVQP